MAGAHPVPMSLSKLRDRLVYHEQLTARLNAHVPPREPLDGSDSDSSNSEAEYFAGGKVDGSSIGFEDISLDILMVGRSSVAYINS